MDQEHILDFLEESEEMLVEAVNFSIQLKLEPDNNKLINKIFRILHSVKGNCAILGFNKIRDLAHSIEELMNLFREKEIICDQHTAQILISSIDDLRNSIANLRNNPAEPDSIHLACKVVDETVKKFKQFNDNDLTRLWLDFSASIMELRENFFQDEQANNFNWEKIINNLDSIGSYLLRKKLINNPEISNKNKDYKKIILNLLDKNDEYSLTESMLSELHCNLKLLRKYADCGTKHFADEILDVYNKVTPLDGVTAFLQEVIRENIEKVVLKKIDNPLENNVNAPNFQQQHNKTLRVQEKNIDDLFNITSELINVSEMYEYIQRGLTDIFGSNQNFLKLQKNTECFQSLSLQLQNKLSRIKRVSVKNFCRKAQRVVYDITSNSEKKIKLDFQGENILIDKSLFAELENVFLHLLRNAVCHGIEPPEQRMAMGKNEEGKILVSFEETDRNLVIGIEDDGKGIFCQQVIQKALDKKIISKNQAEKLIEQDIYKLLFLPGFSTVEHADEVSGRGVGLDVVKKQVASLSGDISVCSEETKGTSIKLVIPKNLSLNIFNGFVIQSCAQNFVLPLNAMGESFKVTQNQIESAPDNSEFISHHGKLYSLLRLNKILGFSSCQDKKDGIAIAVNNDSGDEFVLLVDKIIGIRQVVLKTISGLSSIPEIIYGAAVLGNSKVALVLDTKKFKKFNSKLRGSYERFKNGL